jgi:hypothetical protein
MSNFFDKIAYSMENKIYKNLSESILIKSKKIEIDKEVFLVKRMIGQGYHKQVFVIDDKKGDKVIKVVRKEAKNIISAFLSFEQAIKNQEVLEKLKLNFTKIIDFDKKGPPYRYLVEEKIPDSGICVSELIKNGTLEEDDVRQISEVVNNSEKDKKWQLDMSPFNWFKVGDKLVYTGGTVYDYDENWSFVRVGLMQWIDPKFVIQSNGQSTKIPSGEERKNFMGQWDDFNAVWGQWWKKYLNINIQPK